jgi:hypothetical protein
LVPKDFKGDKWGWLFKVCSKKGLRKAAEKRRLEVNPKKGQIYKGKLPPHKIAFGGLEWN